MTDVVIELTSVINRYAVTVCARIEQEWGAKGASINGVADISVISPHVVADVIVTSFLGDGLKAWILEYGSGSKLDTDNPWFNQFEQDQLHFNPERKNRGYAFVGRSKDAVVYNPDGTTYQSSGKAKGLNLELGIGSKRKNPYIPHEAMHIITDQVKQIIPELRDELRFIIKRVTIKLFYDTLSK